MAGKGAFFLGTTVDPSGKAKPENFTLDSSDLTTHGVIVGMTGSGKTGLGIVMLEEALLAGHPGLVLDPKGDMGNLAAHASRTSLGSGLRALGERVRRDRRRGSAARRLSPHRRRRRGRRGSRDWGSGADRIKALRAAADVTIYTPGSTAGVPLNIVGSLACAQLLLRHRGRALRDEIEGLVTGLLGLVGIDADPLSSREHVLLANLIENAWRAGRDLDLRRAGRRRSRRRRCASSACSSSTRSSRRRTATAARDAAQRRCSRRRRSQPGATGAPLDIGVAALRRRRQAARRDRLRSPTCPTRSASSSSRSCCRSSSRGCAAQPGTSALRALVYMDEVFGFVPPTADAAGEEADPHPAQAGPRVRRRHGARDAEPGRPRLQGDLERRHVDGRPAADRARQGPRARGPQSAAGGADVAALDATISGLAEARVPARQRARHAAGALHDALGDVVTSAAR